MGKRRTKRIYLGSGAGSLRSGTGATAKKPIQRGRSPLRTKKFFNTPIFPSRPKPEGRKLRTFPIPKKELRPITPKSPATGFNSVFDDRIPPGAKRRRKKTAQTMRRRAKR